MQITYTTHKGGNTRYLTISTADKGRILSRLTNNFYRMLEEAGHDHTKLHVLTYSDPVFLKNADRQENNLMSFLSGVLRQHSIAQRDFSVRQIAGIELAASIFDQYYNTGTIKFKEVSETDTTPFGELFA
jgi:hypothetical protein